ncbi:uncharacterized protein [Physcomitrium patens]|uniref:CUE domain-containing protein n=2 Tax=Physcomitrium patens TaxID=3218 RepID=A0A7I4AV19_PHYPA|nr:uncharacterized protein LOC112292166 isoform X2 [Physcomitrium patens]|eukprot:XP_024396142.1 uncharacterized protein LOC112292166 isoform X2 [Physcomitrella patens]
MEEHSVAHLWRCLRDRAMEKETKEWGNKEQRTMLNTLKTMFPQVDVRILKGTVLEGNDIDAAVEFILTEVLEQPSTGKVDERLAKELISKSLKAPGGASDKRFTEVKSAKNHHIKDQNPFDIMGDMFNVTGSSVQDGNTIVCQEPLIDLQSEKTVEDSKLPALGSSPIDIPSGTARMTGVESVTYDEVLQSPYIVMSESLTESEPDTLARPQDRGRTWMNAGMAISEPLYTPTAEKQPVPPMSKVQVKDEPAHVAESLYGSVLDGIEVDYTGADAGARKSTYSWSDDEGSSQKHTCSKGSRWAYESDDDYSDMQESKSSLLAVPSGQFDGMSKLSDEGSRLMESSMMEETYDGLFTSSANSVMTGSSQLLGVDALDELVNGAKADKEALVAAIEDMRAMRSAVEHAEASAQQAKKDAMNGGLDLLAKVEEMQVMLVRAREANEMHAGEVYGEKAVLGTESQELQRRLAQLKEEKERAFAAVEEMRATLQARIDRANEEREAAEKEKRLKEERALAMLAVEEELMAKIAQESRDLDAEEETCTKLRDFLVDRGSIVDSLQGEVAIICEDVEAVKKQLDEGILFGESGFLHMLGSRSLGYSVVSGKDGNFKAGDASDNHFGALSQSGSSYQSAIRAGESDATIEELSTSELVDQVSRIALTYGERDVEEFQKTVSAQSNTDSGDDEGWNLIETSSVKSNKSPGSSPSSVKRSRTEAFCSLNLRV